MKIAPPNLLAMLFSKIESAINPLQLFKIIAPPFELFHFSIFILLISIF